MGNQNGYSPPPISDVKALQTHYTHPLDPLSSKGSSGMLLASHGFAMAPISIPGEEKQKRSSVRDPGYNLLPFSSDMLSFPPEQQEVRDLCSIEGTLFGACCRGGGVYLCDAAKCGTTTSSSVVVVTLQPRGNLAEKCVFGADAESLFAVGCFDGTVKVWKINVEEPSEFEMRSPLTVDGSSENAIRSLCVASSSATPLLLSGSEDGVVRIWDLRTGTILSEATVPSQSSISSILMRQRYGSPHDQVFIAAARDREVCIFDRRVSSGKAVQVIRCLDDLYSGLWPKAQDNILVLGGKTTLAILDVRCVTEQGSVNRAAFRGETWACDSQMIKAICEIDKKRFAASCAPFAGESECAIWTYHGECLHKLPFSSGKSLALCFVPDKQSARGKADRWMLSRDRVTERFKIGQGKFGSVFKGEFELGGRLQPREVAIKIYLVVADAAASENQAALATMSEFQKEVRIMCELDFVNVLRCHGYAIEPDERPNWSRAKVVLEYCEGGDLKDWLKLPEIAETIDVRRKVEVLLQVARGMGYIHGRGVVHLDLKIQNILMSTKHIDAVVKICDFGLSTHLKVSELGLRGTPGYMPPSFLGDRRKIDVYAFSIVCWEVWTGKQAYSDLGIAGAELHRVIVDSGRRPDTCECVDLPGDVLDLMVQSWSPAASTRPLFGEIIGKLEKILEGLSSTPDSSGVD